MSRISFPFLAPVFFTCAFQKLQTVLSKLYKKYRCLEQYIFKQLTGEDSVVQIYY
jgi:hypothetical protein